jgi:hypothetical protein
MSTIPESKAGISRIDTIDTVALSASGGEGVLQGDEGIIHALETTGQEVGMTTRSVLAAAVRIYYSPRLQIPRLTLCT